MQKFNFFFLSVIATKPAFKTVTMVTIIPSFTKCQNNYTWIKKNFYLIFLIKKVLYLFEILSQE